jgi:site-specific recombinase XerD
VKQIFRRASVRARILGNPLGDTLQQYIDYLVTRGHRPDCLHQYVFAVEHFGRWLGGEPVSRDSVARFLSIHLARCHCDKPASRTVNTVRAALNRLLQMLGVPQTPLVLPGVLICLLRDYEKHLRVDAGLARSTAQYRLRYARDLLEHFEVRRIDQVRAWLPTDLAEYVADKGRRLKPGSGQVLASSIRSFLRFLLTDGLLRRDLAAAVPSFAHWRLSALPVVVKRDDLEQLLRVVDARTPIGMRDRAVLLCLMDLGLRAAEVAAVTVDGADLLRGVLRIAHRKERCAAEFPMTERLSTALGHYLRQGRPQCTSRELFVIHRAPIGQPLKPLGIHDIVVRCAARAGIAELIRGTHVIRHSVASSLINAGASIKDIADLFGHRSIDTTAIYAKVDIDSLARVAMPWPGAIR